MEAASTITSSFFYLLSDIYGDLYQTAVDGEQRGGSECCDCTVFLEREKRALSTSSPAESFRETEALLPASLIQETF